MYICVCIYVCICVHIYIKCRRTQEYANSLLCISNPDYIYYIHGTQQYMIHDVCVPSCVIGAAEFFNMHKITMLNPYNIYTLG